MHHKDSLRPKVVFLLGSCGVGSPGGIRVLWRGLRVSSGLDESFFLLLWLYFSSYLCPTLWWMVQVNIFLGILMVWSRVAGRALKGPEVTMAPWED